MRYRNKKNRELQEKSLILDVVKKSIFSIFSGIRYTYKFIGNYYLN